MARKSQGSSRVLHKESLAPRNIVYGLNNPQWIYKRNIHHDRKMEENIPDINTHSIGILVTWTAQ